MPGVTHSGAIHLYTSLYARARLTNPDGILITPWSVCLVVQENVKVHRAILLRAGGLVLDDCMRQLLNHISGAVTCLAQVLFSKGWHKRASQQAESIPATHFPVHRWVDSNTLRAHNSPVGPQSAF